MKFSTDTIIFFIAIILAGICWIGFEFHHRDSDKEISSDLRLQATTPIDNSFDLETLEKAYFARENLYTIE